MLSIQSVVFLHLIGLAWLRRRLPSWCPQWCSRPLTCLWYPLNVVQTPLVLRFPVRMARLADRRIIVL